MQAYYDGTPLLHPSEDVLQYASTDGMLLIEDYLQGIYNTNVDSTDIYSPTQQNIYSKLQLGQLYWPTGAKRFGCGLFLVSSDFLEKLPKFDLSGSADSEDTLGGLRSTVNHLHRYTSKNLDLSEGYKPLQAKMWMLPPRPLFQQRRVPTGLAENTARIPYPHLNGIWVLPLVDDRYFWWNFTTGDFKLPTCTSWENLFKAIFKNLGYTDSQIIIDPISVDYLFPHSIFRTASQLTKVPLLLDTIAHSCGTRIILNYDGSVRVMNAQKSFEEDSTRYSTSNTQRSGGFGSLISTAKDSMASNYSTNSDITKSETEFKKLKSIMRDTAGVIPRAISFLMSGSVYATVTTEGGGETGNVVNAEGDDNTNSAFMSGGQVYYYTSTDASPLPPSTFTRNIGGTTTEVVTPISGDYAYDLNKKLLYPFTTTWGEPSSGKSLPSKYFKINASSYKLKVKSCPEYAQKPSNKTDKEFSQTQLNNFIEVYKNDWLLYQMSDVNLILNGIEKIDPTGMFDYVLYDIGNIVTKVARAPYNDPVQDIYIESYLGDESGCDADAYPCGQCKGMQGGSLTSQLYGFGNSSMFLPYSPVQVKNSTLPINADPANYPNYHKPPYVVKFCLGSAVGNVALDYHFQTQAMVSVYWNGSKVTSRQINGAKSFTCQGCAQCWGRLTFAKTAKTPAYATVVIEKVNDYDTDLQLLQNQNWYMNMRCVDSQPYPAPRAVACDQKLDEVGGIFTLGMFTSIPINIPSSSNGLVPNTSVCVADAAESDFQCGGVNCTIPANLIMSFESPPDSCKWLKDITIPLQQSVFDGGWAGINDQFGPLKDIIQAKLRLVGNNGFDLTFKDIVNVSKPQVQLTSGTTCICTPFKLQFMAGNLTSFSCVGSTTKIIIQEA
jgi:hypothetical protein